MIMMMMMKPDDSSSSLAAAPSSSRRTNSPKHVSHVKTNIGCMSGIFRLVYSHTNRRGGGGKFITSGKKQEKNNSVSEQVEKLANADGVPRSSCNVPRSPTLPAGIRRTNNVSSPENILATPPSEVLTAESAAEKRRRLLEALDKCDEDLKALKQIIDVVKSSVNLSENNNNNNNNNNNDDYNENFSERDNKCLLFNGELQPSPVSVLEDFITPATLMSGYSRRYTNGRAIQQQMKHRKQKKKPGENEEIIISKRYLVDKIRNTTESSSSSSSSIFHDHQAKSSRSISSSDDHQEKVITSSSSSSSPLWASKAMIESVNEVCRDIAWGEKREIGRIGLALQDRIYRDLVEEIVRELDECSPCCMFSLPFEACKRSLHF